MIRAVAADAANTGRSLDRPVEATREQYSRSCPPYRGLPYLVREKASRRMAVARA
jgi:hypothetical protein